MRFLDMLRIAGINMLRGRNRTLLTTLAVTIGVASVILVASLGQSGQNAILLELNKLGVDGINIHTQTPEFGAAQRLTQEDAQALEEHIPALKRAMPITARYDSLTIRANSEECLVWGVGANMNDVLDVTLLHGRHITQQDLEQQRRVVVIEAELAQKYYYRDNIVGKSVSISLAGSSEEYEIIGVIRAQKDTINVMVGGMIPVFIYVPLSCMGSSDIASMQIMAVCHDGADSDVAGEEILTFLNRQYGTRGAFAIENISGYKQRLDDTIGLIALMVSGIAAISLCVAGLGVMSTMLSSADQRRREVGISMALGCHPREIALTFLLESVLICMAGGLIGAVSGVALAGFAAQLIGISFAVNLGGVIAAEAISLLCGIVFGVAPAIRAARLNPIAALRDG